MGQNQGGQHDQYARIVAAMVSPELNAKFRNLNPEQARNLIEIVSKLSNAPGRTALLQMLTSLVRDPTADFPGKEKLKTLAPLLISWAMQQGDMSTLITPEADKSLLKKNPELLLKIFAQYLGQRNEQQAQKDLVKQVANVPNIR